MYQQQARKQETAIVHYLLYLTRIDVSVRTARIILACVSNTMSSISLYLSRYARGEAK